MKKIMLLISICFMAFVSCDGRKSQSKALSDSITDFKNHRALDIIVFKPESPFMRSVDTLLHNGYRVKINTYTDAENNVITDKVENGVTKKTHHRNYKFDILVEKAGIIFYSDSFDKIKANKLFNFRDDFSEKSPLFNFNKKAVLQSISLRDEPSLKNRILIDFTYIIPETDRYTDQTLFIRDDGSVNVVHKTIN